MRRRIVAGNWKMNLMREESISLYDEINGGFENPSGVDIIVFPSMIYVKDLIDRKGKIPVGVQNFYPKDKGAFTGEVSITQIKDCGVLYALIGHSERRMLFHETKVLLKEKVDAAIMHGITPVFCCGEPLEIREANTQNEYVLDQLKASLFHLIPENFKNCIIAYEPVWAIGTGITATIDQAEEMHVNIRSWVKDVYGENISNSISILYGGSCNASNASELFACPNVDGGLIGGAALDSGSFLKIVNSF